MIDIKKLYEATHQGLDIIKWMHPQAEAGKKFRIRTSGDSDPSAMLYKQKSSKYGEVWGITDFGDDGWNSPIDLYMRYTNRSRAQLHEALQELAEQFNVVETLNPQRNLPRIERRKALSDEKNGTRRWDCKPQASAVDLAVMGRTVTQQHLDALGWKSVSWISQTKDGQTTVKYATENYPIFIRECIIKEAEGDKPTEKFYKIYEPLNLDKGFRFQTYPAGVKPKGYNNGLHELRKASKACNDKLPAAIICSGERDALCCLSLGFQPVWFNSETYRVEESDIREIMNYADVLYNIPDIDETGIRKGKELALRFIDIKTIWLPASLHNYHDHRGKPRKDLRDWADLHPDPEEFRKLMQRAKHARFWVRKSDSGLAVDSVCLHYFLMLNGYYSYDDELNPTEPQLIKIDGYEVKKVTPKDIRQFLRSWVETYVGDLDVLNLVLNSTKLTMPYLEGLPGKRLDFTNCTPTSQTFFFTNVCVTVTGSGMAVVRREEHKSDSYVWSDSVIRHDFHMTGDFFTVERVTGKDGKPVFRLIINNVGSNLMGYFINSSRLHWRKEMETCFATPEERKAYAAAHKFDLRGDGLTPEEQEEQVLCFINKVFVVGYVLHNYKNPSKPWAVYVMDNLVGSEGQRNGGSGKSIFCKALQKMTPTVCLSGKEPKDFENSHIFEPVKGNIRLVIISDCAKTLDIERFYDRITEDFMVNPKNKTIYTLPFEVSPKMAFTTNYVPVVLDPSSERRLIYVVLSDYYHQCTDENDYLESRAVSDDFGKNILPPNSTDGEWNADLNFMLQCEKFYLSLCQENVKIQPPMKNILIRKNMSVMGDNFMEWATEFFSPDSAHLDCYLVKDEVYEDCRTKTNMKLLTAIAFWKKLKAFVAVTPGIAELNPSDLCNDGNRIKEKDGERRYLIYLRTVDAAF